MSSARGNLTSISSALEALVGTARPSPLSAHARMLYRAMSRQGVVDPAHLEQILGEPLASSGPLQELTTLGLVRQTDHGVVAIPRRQAIDELLGEQARLLTLALEHVLERQQRINTLNAEAESLDVEAVERIETVSLSGRADGEGLYGPTGQASKELMAIHPGGQFTPDVLEKSLRRAKANLDAGVRLRVIHQSSALAHSASVDYLANIESMGGTVRIRENLPFRMLLVDRNAAVCAPTTALEGQDTYLLRGQRIMMLLDRMFETTWVDAVPLRSCLSGTGPARLPDPDGTDPVADQRATALTSQQLTILRLLAEGETDQSIARQLGITPRTVTRRIAEIYAALGVDSRFQAGAVAHRLGLV